MGRCHAARDLEHCKDEKGGFRATFFLEGRNTPSPAIWSSDRIDLPRLHMRNVVHTPALLSYPSPNFIFIFMETLNTHKSSMWMLVKF